VCQVKFATFYCKSVLLKLCVPMQFSSRVNVALLLIIIIIVIIIM
jgi:hypothetical protein